MVDASVEKEQGQVLAKHVKAAVLRRVSVQKRLEAIRMNFMVDDKNERGAE
jgi:hypothetical protein